MPTIQQLIRQLPCPACGAEPGKKCSRGDGVQRYCHVQRVAAYRESLGLPEKPQVNDVFQNHL